MQCRKRLSKLCISQPCLTQGHTEAQRSEPRLPEVTQQGTGSGPGSTFLSPRAAPSTELIFPGSHPLSFPMAHDQFQAQRGQDMSS